MSLPTRPPDQEDGFTLIEMLVAIALLAVVAAMVFGSLVTTNRAIEAGRDLSAREQTTRRVLHVMAEEISFSKQSTEFQWVGINGTYAGYPADTLAFVAMNDGSSGSTAKESEMIRVVYTRDRDRLIRYARKNLYGLTDESLGQVELADRVRGFNLRYFDGQGRVWVDDWQTANKIPAALLIEVTFEPPETLGIPGTPDVDPWTVREWVTIEAS